MNDRPSVSSCPFKAPDEKHMKSSSPCSQHGLGSLTHTNHLEIGQAFGSGPGETDPPPPLPFSPLLALCSYGHAPLWTKCLDSEPTSLPHPGLPASLCPKAHLSNVGTTGPSTPSGCGASLHAGSVCGSLMSTKQGCAIRAGSAPLFTEVQSTSRMWNLQWGQRSQELGLSHVRCPLWGMERRSYLASQH